MSKQQQVHLKKGGDLRVVDSERDAVKLEFDGYVRVPAPEKPKPSGRQTES